MGEPPGRNELPGVLVTRVVLSACRVTTRIGKANGLLTPASVGHSPSHSAQPAGSHAMPVVCPRASRHAAAPCGALWTLTRRGKGGLSGVTWEERLGKRRLENGLVWPLRAASLSPIPPPVGVLPCNTLQPLRWISQGRWWSSIVNAGRCCTLIRSLAPIALSPMLLWAVALPLRARETLLPRCVAPWWLPMRYNRSLGHLLSLLSKR
jgi:hypothetical protein